MSLALGYSDLDLILIYEEQQDVPVYKKDSVYLFFFNGSTAPWGPRPPHVSRLHDHTF